MLEIIIPAEEMWDESKEEFVLVGKEQVLRLEHSLVSISKWESKWCKSFLSTENKTNEETIDYIKCMTVYKNCGSDVYDHLNSNHIQQVMDYINSPMTATTIREVDNGAGASNRNTTVTSELIYCWMTELEIPWECQKWHLNRLITLIRVCQERRQPPKKLSQSEIIKRNRAINKANRQKFKSKG